MNVFGLRDAIVGEYARFTRSFTKVRAADIRAFLDREYEQGQFCPTPLVELNPSFVPGATVQELVREGVLHEECGRIFRIGKDRDRLGEDLRLHRHQEEAIRIAQARRSYVLTTGTGSGKSLSYFIPIVDRALRCGKGEARITAIVVYPMNALCNSQLEDLRKFLEAGYPEGAAPVTFARYTGQESQPERDVIARRPPDILLTNYMMLELILTRQNETDQAVLNTHAARERALARGRGILAMLTDELTPETAPWYTPEWLERTIATCYREFERTFDRWSRLYKATSQQMRRAQEVMNSAAASPKEREQAKQRHDEAFQQQSLLLDVRSVMNSDFYTYRFLASQGFLPGYNFPRLPLLAYVPARRREDRS